MAATLSATEQQRLGLVRPELMRNLLWLMDVAGAQLGYRLAVPDDGGTRTVARQAALYQDALEQGGGTDTAYAVATPGHSRHNYGAAFDLHIIAGGSSDDGSGTLDDYRLLAELAEQCPYTPGLTAGYYFAARGEGKQDQFHFQLDEPFQASVDKWAALKTAGIIKTGAIAGAVLLAVVLLRR